MWTKSSPLLSAHTPAPFSLTTCTRHCLSTDAFSERTKRRINNARLAASSPHVCEAAVRRSLRTQALSTIMPSSKPRASTRIASRTRAKEGCVRSVHHIIDRSKQTCANPALELIRNIYVCAGNALHAHACATQSIASVVMCMRACTWQIGHKETHCTMDSLSSLRCLIFIYTILLTLSLFTPMTRPQLQSSTETCHVFLASALRGRGEGNDVAVTTESATFVTHDMASTKQNMRFDDHMAPWRQAPSMVC